MRISVNLATRPFVELRPLLARLRIAMVALAVLAIGLGFYLPVMNARAAVATADMNALQTRTAALQQERATNESRMRRPENQSVLERSQFLNALFARKSFSSTAVMMDLEHQLPAGVQVTSIDPVISKEGDLSIRLRVTGDRDKSIQLVRNLERSQRFLAPRLSGESMVADDRANAIGARGPGAANQQPGFRNASAGAADQAGGNAVEFEIYSGYNPLPPKTESAARPETATGKSRPASPQPAVHHQRKPNPALPAPRPAVPGGAR